MSDPIELTSAERTAAIGALWASSTDNYGYSFGAALDSIIAAVNKVRAGDLVGSVRRSDGGTIALLTDGNAESPWQAFSPHGMPLGQWTQTEVSGWPIIYSPESSS